MLVVASLRSIHSPGQLATLLAALAIAALIIDTVLRRASAALVLSVAVALQCFSGYSHHLGFPIGPDRVCLVLGLGMLARERHRARAAGREVPDVPWGLVHLVLAMVVGWAVVSAVFAHTFQSSVGFYALLDRLGVVPFVLFTLAPVAFPTERERKVLLTTLVCLGLYLGVVAFAEIVHLNALVWPRYILNPNLGIHVGRARGPFLEAVANGLAMFECGIAAAIAFGKWRTRAARAVAAAVILLCGAGILFTLTRAVWLAALAAPVAMVTYRPLRRLLLPAMVVGAVGFVVALAFVPGLSSQVHRRTNDVSPVWDRYNTDAAAVRIVVAHPLTGVGWERFVAVSDDWIRQAGSYPLTGTGIEVHNVLLSHAAELGLPAAMLWLIALALAVGPGVLRRSPRELAPWSVGLLAVSVNWALVAAFGPLSYALPNSLLWLWAGLTRPAVWRGTGRSDPGDPDRLAARPEAQPALPVFSEGN